MANNEELQHDTKNLCKSILKESNMASFEDNGLTWLHFSQSPRKFMQILFLNDRNH